MLNSVNGTNANIKTNPNLNASKTGGYASKIIIASKGEAGYDKQMDGDGDGILTLEEVNNYCSEKGISEQEKIKMLTMIMTLKGVEEVSSKTFGDKEKVKEAENERIYARRGDKKYDERMDENKDSKITYEEYEKYCKNRTEGKDENKQTKEAKTPEEKEALKAYSESEPVEGEIQVEVSA